MVKLEGFNVRHILPTVRPLIADKYDFVSVISMRSKSNIYDASDRHF